MIFLELEKENLYLLGFWTEEILELSIPKGIRLLKFKFISTEAKPKIDIKFEI